MTLKVKYKYRAPVLVTLCSYQVLLHNEFVQIIHLIDRVGILWHRLPVFPGLLYLATRRHLHQHYNLLNVGVTPAGVRFNPVDYPYRRADGSYNDPFNEGTVDQGTFFGRNMAPSYRQPQHKVYMLGD